MSVKKLSRRIARALACTLQAAVDRMLRYADAKEDGSSSLNPLERHQRVFGQAPAQWLEDIADLGVDPEDLIHYKASDDASLDGRTADHPLSHTMPPRTKKPLEHYVTADSALPCVSPKAAPADPLPIAAPRQTPSRPSEPRWLIHSARNGTPSRRRGSPNDNLSPSIDFTTYVNQSSGAASVTLERNELGQPKHPTAAVLPRVTPKPAPVDPSPVAAPVAPKQTPSRPPELRWVILPARSRAQVEFTASAKQPSSAPSAALKLGGLAKPIAATGFTRPPGRKIPVNEPSSIAEKKSSRRRLTGNEAPTSPNQTDFDALRAPKVSRSSSEQIFIDGAARSSRPPVRAWRELSFPTGDLDSPFCAEKGSWPELPETASATPEHWLELLRRQERRQRVDEEQRGFKWNELPF